MAENNLAKLSIIEGDSYEFVGGEYTEYVNGITYSTNGNLLVTANDGKNFGSNPDDFPQTKDRIIDIVLFIPGTTDPVNTEGKQHQANTDYWKYFDEKTQKETEKSLNNFWNKVKELKPQFLDLHIEGSFFSWSGDNNTKERIKASERLLDMILRVYPGWKNEEVHFHLIGHSHGGNVINQFTELIANKEMIAKSDILKPRKISEFPKLWDIKSITYLSTPFFQKKHQLNHSKLHKECKIINVHNEYDLTQQLIAYFSLNNLEGLLKSFQIEKFNSGIQTVKNVNTNAIIKYLAWKNKERAIIAWREMAKAFSGLNIVAAEFIKYIESLKIENSNLQEEKKSFILLLKQLQNWTYNVYNNYNAGIGKGHDKITWANNLNLVQGLKVLNTLFAIITAPKDSYLLSLLAGIFGESKGVTDSIDETSWTPKKQTKNLTIIDVPIFESDSYNSRNKKKEFNNFLKGIQETVHNRNLEDMLMRLFSQFIKPSKLNTFIEVIDGLEYIVTGNLDAELKILRKNFQIYKTFVIRYHVGLVTENDENKIADMMKRPGTIPYLAMTSHSLSHTQFWKKTEEGLKTSFSSGKNSGYKIK